MNIAICDDDINSINRIEQFLQPYMDSEELNIDTYISGKEFIENINGVKVYDIVYLDIEMSEMSGLEIAGLLKRNNNNTIIIFITAHMNYVSDTFRLGAFQFLLKPIEESVFNTDFLRAVNEYKRIHHLYKIRWKDSVSFVKYGDIYYIEGYNRHLFISCDDERRECVGKIQEEEQKLELYNFVRCHQGFLVNMAKIKEINRKALILVNDIQIPVGRKFRENLLLKFNLFLAGKLI